MEEAASEVEVEGFGAVVAGAKGTVGRFLDAEVTFPTALAADHRAVSGNVWH